MLNTFIKHKNTISLHLAEHWKQFRSQFTFKRLSKVKKKSIKAFLNIYLLLSSSRQPLSVKATLTVINILLEDVTLNFK